jgi:N-acetylmuramoyl-L-alanine amidase
MASTPGASLRRLAPALLATLLALVLTAGPVATTGRATTLPLTGVVIAIDPGHNGGNATHASQISKLVWIGTAWKPCNSVGTTTTSGFTEHRLNWLVARGVQARLEALGATVYLTRTSDTGVGPCVDVRGRFGERVGARLLVSNHGDGAPSSCRGFFVMRPGVVAGWTDDIATRSSRLANAMRRGLLDVGLPIANYYVTDGIKTRTDLGTLNWSDVPAVMVELGNMKNSGDAARMASPNGRATYARGILAGIRSYLGR